MRTLVVAPDNTVVLNPIAEGLQEVSGDVRVERLWRELNPDEQRDVIDGAAAGIYRRGAGELVPGAGDGVGQ